MTHPEYNNKVELKKSSIYVYFDHHGHEITFKFSTWSGREEVFVNNQLVSESRTWSTKSTHKFTLDGTVYELSIATIGFKGVLLGRGEVILKANQQIIDRDIFCFTTYMMNETKSNPLKIALTLLPFFIIGVVVGFLIGESLV